MSFEGRTSSKPPLEDISEALKSTLIFLPKTGSAKENNVLCCAIELFVVIFHIEAICKRLLHCLNESTDVLLVQKTRAENNVNT